MFRELSGLTVRCALVAAGISMTIATATVAQDADTPAAPPPPAVLFTAPLEDAPGKQLVVVELKYAPNSRPASTAEQHPRGHRHPGSVYVHVTQGQCVWR